MEHLPYSLPVAFGIAVALLFALVITVRYAWNDWVTHYDPMYDADTIALPVDDFPVPDPTLSFPTVDLPVVAAPTPQAPTQQAAPMPRPPVASPAPSGPPPLFAPLKRKARPGRKASEPLSHEMALNEALFIAAQATVEPGETRLVPVQSVSADSAYAPEVEEHVQQALLAGHSYRDLDDYEAKHRAQMV